MCQQARLSVAYLSWPQTSDAFTVTRCALRPAAATTHSTSGSMMRQHISLPDQTFRSCSVIRVHLGVCVQFWLKEKAGPLWQGQERTSSVCGLNLMQAVCLQLGQYKRNFTRLQVTEDDECLFVGSTSGDVAQVSQSCTVHITFIYENAAICQAYAALNAPHQRPTHCVYCASGCKVGPRILSQLGVGAQISTQSMHLVRRGPKPREALSSVEALCCMSDSIILAAGSEGRIIALDLRARCACYPS